MKYQFYVLDWNPNGTNDLVVFKNGKQIDCRQEVLFGVNVNKLNTPAKYLDRHDDTQYFRIPEETIKNHVAHGLCGEFEQNCKWLSKYLTNK